MKQPSSQAAAQEEPPGDTELIRVLKPVIESFALIKGRYLYETDIEKCRDDMLKGLSDRTLLKPNSTIPDALNEKQFVCLDRWSGFSTREEVVRSNEESRGYFGGIGILFEKQSEHFVVTKVRNDGDAKRVGMQKGDVLLRARNVSEEKFTDLKSTRDIVNKLRGPIGSTVIVVVQRGTEERTLTPIVRKRLNVKTVSSMVLPKGIGYVRLKAFSSRTGDELEDALASFLKLGDSPRVIIDLRENPGGMVFSAWESLFYFSKKDSDILTVQRARDKEIVTTIGRLAHGCGGLTADTQRSCFVNPKTSLPKSPGRFAHYRIVIIVNEYSASAAEIFSGTMKDWGSAHKNFIVVGETSFGKGVVQTLFPLSGDTMLRLTTSEYLVGNSRTHVHHHGVEPDYIIEDSRFKENDDFDWTKTLTQDDNQFLLALHIWGLETDPALVDFTKKKHVDKYNELITDNE